MSQRTVELILSARNGGLVSVLGQSARAVTSFADTSERASKRSVSAWQRTQKFAKEGALAFAAAAAVMGKATIDFDTAMRNVNSLMHLSETGFAGLEQQVLGLSKTLPQSAQTLAEGLYDITSSGFAGADGLTVLKASAEAASAGMTDTSTAAAAIAAVLNAYGMSAADAGDVSDILFQAVNVGVVSFNELASSIGDVVGAAAAAKVPIQDVSSAIATMTLTGISGAESATSLNQLIAKLVQPSEALQGVYKKLGYESGATALQTRGLRGVMDDLQKATGGNITTLLQLFPEIRAARGALALMAADGSNYARVAGQIEDADARRGATMRTLNEQMKSVSAQAKLMWNRIMAEGIEAGTKVLPVILQLMHGAEHFGQTLAGPVADGFHAAQPLFDGLVHAGSELWGLLQGLGETAGPFVLAIGKLAATGALGALTLLVDGLGGLAGFLKDNTALVLGLAVAIGVTLLGSMATAAGGIKVLAWKAFGEALAGVMTAAEGANAALLGVTATQAAATAGLTLIIGAAIHTYQEVQRTNKAMADMVQNIKDVETEASKTTDTSKLEDLLKKLAELRKPIDAQIAGINYNNQLYHQGLAPSRQDNDTALFGQDVKALAAYTYVDSRLTKVKSNVKDLSDLWGVSQDKVRGLADSLGIDLAGSLAVANNKFSEAKDAQFGVSAVEEELIKAMGDLADSAMSAEDRVSALDAALKALFGGQLGVNEATRQWNQGIDDLTEALKKNGATVDLTTEKGRQNSALLDGQVNALGALITAKAKDGASSAELNRVWGLGVQQLRDTMDAAGFTKKQIDDYTKSLGLVPGKVDTILNVAGSDAAQAEVKKLQDQLNRLQNKTVEIHANYYYKGVAVGRPVPGITVAQRRGGIMVEHYADGGIRDFIKPLPKTAAIVKDGANLVNWAEPGTGGEAFIPMGMGNRRRSEEILARVAEMFGGQFVKYATGGTTAKAAAAAASKTAKQTAEERQKKADEAYQRAANNAELRRLLAPIPVEVNFDLGGAVGDLTSRSEQRAHNQAEVAARRSKNPYDSADDFYKKPNLSLGDYSKEFSAQIKTADQWRRDLAKIASVAGDDVAGQLRSMGERGIDLVRKLATGTASQVKQIAAQLRKLGPAGSDALNEFSQNMRAETSENVAFQRDLMTLISRGRADLASKLAAMGVDQAGTIAAQAARAGGPQLAQIGRDLAASDNAQLDTHLLDALRLAGILSSGGGKIGVTGLAARSGMSIPDVLGLLTTYQTKVFATLGGAMKQVQADQQLIAAGKPLSGLAAGGIVAGSTTRGGGLFYRWAEPGSGGESLIPHGPQHRSRAWQLWAETGRILGVKGGGGTTVVRTTVVAANAVTVDVDLSGQSISAAEAKQLVHTAVSEGFSQLADEIARGEA